MKMTCCWKVLEEPEKQRENIPCERCTPEYQAENTDQRTKIHQQTRVPQGARDGISLISQENLYSEVTIIR